jgi:serine/threonine protein kinase
VCGLTAGDESHLSWPAVTRVALSAGMILGRYRLERKLGEGSTSQVFLATHTELDRPMALKILSPELGVEDGPFARFVQEAKIANTIKSEHIVEVYDVIRSEQPRLVAFVMELVQGPSLKAMRPFRMIRAQVAGVTLQLVAAMNAAHQAGVIHRDLKPDNLLFTSDPRTEAPEVVPRLKVIDFGIAKRAGAAPLTAVGQMMGTPAYMAPEQITGSPPTSAATDVFALGAILYELWSGERAFPQSTIPDVVRAKLRGHKPAFDRLDLPAAMQDRARQLLEACLELEPGRRPKLTVVGATLLEIARQVAAEGLAPKPEAPKPSAEPEPNAPGAPTDPVPVLPSPPRGQRTVTSMSAQPPSPHGIPAAATEPDRRPPIEAATEEVLPILPEARTEEALPVLTEQVQMPVLLRDSILLERVRPPSTERSYESIEVVLHQVPSDLLGGSSEELPVLGQSLGEVAMLTTALGAWEDPRSPSTTGPATLPNQGPATPSFEPGASPPVEPLPLAPTAAALPRPAPARTWGLAVVLVSVALALALAALFSLQR